MEAWPGRLSGGWSSPGERLAERFRDDGHAPLERLQPLDPGSGVRRSPPGSGRAEKDTDPAAPQLEVVRDIILGEDPPLPPPRIPLLLLWGEADRLMGAGPNAAKRLHGSLPGSQLTFIPAAGHLPQVERPDAFVSALLAFLTSRPSTQAQETR